MANINCILGIVVLLFTFYTWTEAVALRNSTAEQPDFTMSEKSELANKDLDGDTMTGDGESGAFRRVQRNADPCVYTYCKWPRYCDGNVYVPYVLDDSYSTDQKNLIVSSMSSISQYTCVRFLEKRYQRDYLHIRNFRDCSSKIGRQGGAQDLKLEASKCLRTRTIQHELLHALGFRHEHSRSDRDQYVNVLWQNIKEGRFKMIMFL
ncbi:high choriolytic enzyme 2-like [Boleophthalmus pectinirostris]|uniref:high choriolytic enzyme 2-like n=1 Tax=Boleophthalmus pectinirostris TaxID=150288 RepID=UPI002430A8F1|nr:high choriolytic enzyme 2-like [Boleophthalmus pectinirostris]